MSARIGDWLGGIGAATWLFLPIAASSIDGRLIMMWQPRHTAALAIAWLAVVVVAAGGLALARSTAAFWIRVGALVIASAPVVLSALNLIVRRAADELVSPSIAGWVIAALGLLALAVLVILLLRRGVRLIAQRLRYFLTTSSLLAVPFWIGVVELPGPSVGGLMGPPASVSAAASQCHDIDVLLLDELSYSALFAHGEPSRSSVAQLAGSARVYHHAISPTTLTALSVSSYLADVPPDRLSVVGAVPMVARDDGTRISLDQALKDRGLFREAKRRGYRTEVLGWYFPYCEELGAAVDRCQTFSMYNAGTLTRGISPLAPFLTIANMWPYQWPTGLLKRPAAVSLHSAEFDELRRLAGQAPGVGPVLRWIHFNVPHRPWLEGNGWLDARAFELEPRRYDQQLDEVDRAVTSALDGLRAAHRYDDATIVLTSDHGARHGLRPDDPRWVPLVIHAPGQNQRTDVNSPVEVRRVLNDIFSVACSTAR